MDLRPQDNGRQFGMHPKTGHAFFLYTNFVLVQFKEVLHEKRGDH